jgi:hypothetical protein
MNRIGWSGDREIQVQRFICGHCGSDVASQKGLNGAYKGHNPGAYISICPNCSFPTFIVSAELQIPGVRYGNDVEGIDEATVQQLYNEARDCTAASAHTAAVLCCRKILMHIAVAKGAEAGENFASYVDYLADKGYIPPGGKDWVDHIRKIGNQANHEIVISDQNSSKELIAFVEMLLKFIYEFPARIKAHEE